MDIITKNDIRENAKDYMVDRLENEGAIKKGELKSEVEEKFECWPGTFSRNKDIMGKEKVIMKRGIPSDESKRVERAFNMNTAFSKYMVLKEELLDDRWILILFFLLVFLVGMGTGVVIV